MHLFFVHFLEYLLLFFLDDNVDEESEQKPQGVA